MLIHWTPIDPLLRKAYLERNYGHLKVIAIDYGVSVRALSTRALKLGLPRMTVKRVLFSEEETAFMIEQYPISAYKLIDAMVKHGFKQRSRSSIYNHYNYLREMGRLSDRGEALVDKDIYTLDEVVELFATTRCKINSLINNKLLKSNEKHKDEYKRHTVMIERKDLHHFMKTYPSHWDSKKCDHYWLVDILSSSSINTSFQIVRQDSVGVKSDSDYQEYAV